MAPYGRAQPATITIEFADRILRCEAPDLNIGFRSGGRWDDMVIHNPYDVQLTHKKEETPVPPEEPKTPESGPTPEQDSGLKAIQRAAQQIERAQFNSARAVERAILDAQQTKAVADHDFSMAVLEALHAGITQEVIESHLVDLGFNQLEERVDSVHTLDTDMLYEVLQ